MFLVCKKMVYPRQRHRAPVSSRRYLSLRHSQQILAQLRAQAESPQVGHSGDDEVGNLSAGTQRLYSSDVPGVQAGDYLITVTQKVEHVEGEKRISKNPPSKQSFHAKGPRFSLPDNALYSVYPPPGHEVNNNVLPHAVLNDPTFPWERPGSIAWESSNPLDAEHNRVPWIGLLTFVAEELTISTEDLPKLFTKNTVPIKQSETLSIEVPNDYILGLASDTAVGPPFREEDLKDATLPNVNLIFPKADIVQAIFSAYNDDGVRVQKPNLDVSRYRYLSHMRTINTKGMAIAGETEGDPERDFGVCVSNRSAPSNLPKTSPVYVHLVSLEKLEDITLPSDENKRIAIISLYSWSYLCLPPASVDIKTTLQNLATTANFLRPNLPGDNPTPESQAKMRALQRLKDGYSLIRYRTQTGEETVAFTRGPFIPAIVTENSVKQSNSSANLMIMDKELSILDISYSTAWQLGRIMGLADRAFTTALSRARRQIADIAINNSKIKVLEAVGMPHRSKIELLDQLKDYLNDLDRISKAEFDVAHCSETYLRKSRDPRPVDLSFTSPEISNFLNDELEAAARLVGSTTDPAPMGWNSSTPYPYNEINTPFSVDWMLVFRFVLDLYHLINIPMHYLITDPAHVPEERLRFFYIDQNWIEALVDGALSLGNQIDPTTDRVRRAMKLQINNYLNEKYPGLKYLPMMPRYGFFLRSAVVTQFPDLKVEAAPEKIGGTSMLLRHEVLSKDLMIGLLSAPPDQKELRTLTFTVPAHQQFFSLGFPFDNIALKMSYKRITTNSGIDSSDRHSIVSPEWKRDARGTDNRPVVYKWGHTKDKDNIRILLVEKLAADVYTTITNEWKRLNNGNKLEEPYATAGMVGIQLNSTALQLEFLIPKTSAQLPSHLLTCEPLETPEPYDFPQKSIKKIREPLTYSFNNKKFPPLPDFLPPHHKSVLSSTLFDLPPEKGSATPDSWTALTRPASISSFIDLASPSQPHSTDSCSPTLLAPPQFDFAVWPASKPKSPTVPILPTKQDLIFSIVRPTQNDASNFKIKLMTLSFYVGRDDEPSLMNNYVGVYANMVSNLRFNVIAVYSKDNKYLQLRLLPRSRKGWVAVKDFTELSVQLFRVVIKPDNPLPIDNRIKIKVRVMATFIDSEGVYNFDITLK